MTTLQDAEIERLKVLLEDQRQTIAALNLCVGGEGSTSTENLTRNARLEQEIEQLQANLDDAHCRLGRALREADTLREQVLSLSADAARYRWLMDNYATGDGYDRIDAALNDGDADTKLSPAIDSAIAAVKGETK